MNLFRFFLLSVLLGTLALDARACRCGASAAPLQEFGRATAVFAGKVLDPGDQNVPHPLATFAVTQVWKGKLPATVQIRAGLDANDCAYSFAPHRVYLLYAFGAPDALWTDVCSRTKPLMNARLDLVVLGKPREVRPLMPAATSIPTSLSMPIVAVLIVAVLGVISWLWQRRARKA